VLLDSGLHFRDSKGWCRGTPPGISLKKAISLISGAQMHIQKQVPLKRCYITGLDRLKIRYFVKKGGIWGLFRGCGHHFLWNPKTGLPEWQKEPYTSPEKSNSSPLRNTPKYRQKGVSGKEYGNVLPFHLYVC
jgi:hypothetical protein